MRHIPAAMATQHPDNASSPYWKDNGEAFIAAREELSECIDCFKELKTTEYMWDFEGKHADEAVVDRLFSLYFEYFKKHPLGKELFLTFRIPNIWQEKGYSLLRALMVILTSEDFAKDLGFHGLPLFEAILPMTESADQLIYIQKAFQKLSHFKTKIFNHRKDSNNDHLELIPLSEGVKHQLAFKKLLQNYLELHRKNFGSRPEYLRPFIARSDPAMTSGHITTALANKIALSDIYDFGEEQKMEMFPIIGVGSLPFRGGLSPEDPENFIRQHGGVRTVTIQSAFRYDYPLDQAKSAIKYLQKRLPNAQVQSISGSERSRLAGLVRRAEKFYQDTMRQTLRTMDPIFRAVPARRERRQHIGLLAYQRKLGSSSLPRAISFTGSFYSVGVPPEFIGLGRFLASLTKDESKVVEKYYINLEHDIAAAGHYLNKDNLNMLSKVNKGFAQISRDVKLSEKYLGHSLGPENQTHHLHKNLSSNAWLLRGQKERLQDLIMETGVLRKSLG